MRAILLLVGVLLSTESSAQSILKPSPAIMRRYEAATQTTIREVLRKVEPLLTASERIRYNRVRVMVEEDSWNIYGMRAISDKSEVAVPLGLVYILDHIDSAVLQTEIGGIPQDRVISYLRVIVEEARENERRREMGESLRGLTAFPAHAGLSSAQIRQIERHPQYTANKDVLKLSTFAFFIYHELAHLIVPEAAESVLLNARERAADNFALRKALAADFSPMLSFFSFAFYAALHSADGVDETKQGYEPSLCRGARFYVTGLEAALRDPGYVRYAETRGQLQSIKSAPAKIAALLREDGVSCTLEIPPSLQDVPSSGVGSVPDPTVELVETSVRTWEPVPGTCSGASGELWVDDEHVADFNNTQDSEDLELGELSIGRHRFAFKSVRAYCIAGYAPFPMRTAATRLSCEGTFSVPKSGRLRMSMTLLPGRKLACNIK